MHQFGRTFVSTLLCFFLFSLPSCKNDDDPTSRKQLEFQQAYIGSILLHTETQDIPVDGFILVTFKSPLDLITVSDAITLRKAGQPVSIQNQFLDGGRTIKISPSALLDHNTSYQLELDQTLKGADGEIFPGMVLSFRTAADQLKIQSADFGGLPLVAAITLQNVPADNLIIKLTFSHPLNPTSVTAATVKLTANNTVVPAQLEVVDGTSIRISVQAPLNDFVKHALAIAGLKGSNAEEFEETSISFYSGKRSGNDFSTLPDEQLLTLVQQQTFKYFYDFAHPSSGMARERNTSGSTVTTGGTGFGIMALIVGVERGFISRQQALDRMDRILDFLETADRFHGVWPHWLNGDTGKVIPFSTKDNGGDLVETSFLVQGLITFRQYLNIADATEQGLANRINELWRAVEWDWYRKNNENVLYWHWSPTYNWEMNFPMYGYYEEQITYFLAASSPTHGIPKVVYTNGYGKNGAIVKNNLHYGIKLPLEKPAPLFWVHYSYLGLDPHFSDDYANYWEQNVNASLINQAYCVANPKKFVGYSDECWGLTSSDNQNGYNAHSPINDLGVISPTAALSSFPYTPEQSMKALKFFYYKLGDRLWGEYGFYDAFNLTEGWTANSYLAIDQGPIIIMIENYRTQKLWNLFMSAPEVQTGISTLSFKY